MHVQTEHRRCDRGDSNASQSALVSLVELADIDAARRGLLCLAHPVDDDPTTAVCHCGYVLWEIRPRQAPRRRQFGLPIQIVRLDYTSSHGGVEELVSQWPWCRADGAMKCCEAHGLQRRVGRDLNPKPRTATPGSTSGDDPA